MGGRWQAGAPLRRLPPSPPPQDGLRRKEQRMVLQSPLHLAVHRWVHLKHLFSFFTGADIGKIQTADDIFFHIIHLNGTHLVLHWSQDKPFQNPLQSSMAGNWEIRFTVKLPMQWHVSIAVNGQERPQKDESMICWWCHPADVYAVAARRPSWQMWAEAPRHQHSWIGFLVACPGHLPCPCQRFLT